MDKSIRKNILLGFFVLLGIVLFIIGIFQVGSKNGMFTKTFVITAKFANATGLKTGGNVRFNGVKVGIIKGVNLINDTVVQVDMQIEESKRMFITKNAIAAIASDGLMGDKLVNITTLKNGGATIQNNDTIQSHNPINTDRVLETLNQSNDNIKVITQNLKILTTDLNSDNGTIQSLYKDPEMARNLKQSFNNLNIATNKVLLVSSSLQEITSQIKHGNGAIGEVLYDTTLGKNLLFVFEKLKETSNQLNATSNQLSITMQRVNSGKGAANLLLADTSFATNIQQSMINIKNAAKGLDENMEALKHSVLLRRYFRKQAKGK